MGRISNKVIAEIKKGRDYLQKRKVVSLKDFLPPKDVKSVDELIRNGYDPMHAAYVSAQNVLSYFSETISVLPALEEFYRIADFTIKEYMPSGPPWSPLTRSYFSCWLYLDVFFGPDKETIATCLIDVYSTLAKGMSVMVEIISAMQASRMGIYEHCGLTGKYVKLRELISEEEKVCQVPAGYRGEKGQLWFARVLPSFLDRDPSIVFTTPYVLQSPGKSEWLSYFARTLPKTGIPAPDVALLSLMKYGLTRLYWPEYILAGYCGHQEDAIFLEGVA